MKEAEMTQIAAWMDTIVSAPHDERLIDRTAAEIKELCSRFPAPGIAGPHRP
jgi:glycine hydroxymethyltransferase